MQAETFTPPSDDQVEEFGVTWDPECHGTDGPVHSSYCRYVYPQHSTCFLCDYLLCRSDAQ